MCGIAGIWRISECEENDVGQLHSSLHIGSRGCPTIAAIVTSETFHSVFSHGERSRCARSASTCVDWRFISVAVASTSPTTTGLDQSTLI